MVSESERERNCVATTTFDSCYDSLPVLSTSPHRHGTIKADGGGHPRLDFEDVLSN